MLSVLPDTENEIAGDSDVEGAADAAEDVHQVALVARHVPSGYRGFRLRCAKGSALPLSMAPCINIQCSTTILTAIELNAVW